MRAGSKPAERSLRRDRRGSAAGWVGVVIIVVLVYLVWRAGWLAPLGFHP